MTHDRELTRLLESWLKEEAHEDVWRVVDTVLDQLDNTPQHRAWWPVWRFSTMTPMSRLAFATVAVLAAAVVGFGLVSGRNVGDEPSPSPTATPMSFVSAPHSLDAGTYVVDDVFPVPLAFTVPDGWQKLSADRGSVILTKPSSDGRSWSASIQFWHVVEVYRDPCRIDLGTFDPGPGVDDLVAAIVDRPGVQATTPETVTLAGRPAQYFESTNPSDFSDCSRSQWAEWSADGAFDAIGHTEHQGLTVPTWVLDDDGTRVLVSAPRYPDTSAEDVGEIDRILESVRFGGR
jgi:hypothetical protein